MSENSDKEKEPPDLRDPEQFAEFYDSTSRDLWLRCYGKLGDPHDASDVTHEAFRKFMEMLETGAEIQHPKAYLDKTADNLIKDRARRPEPDSLFDEQLGLPNEPAVDANTQVAREVLKAILDAVESLPRQQREVVRRRLFWRPECKTVLDELGFGKGGTPHPSLDHPEGASIEEIARILNKRPAAVRRLYNRGLVNIRHAIRFLFEDE